MTNIDSLTAGEEPFWLVPKIHDHQVVNYLSNKFLERKENKLQLNKFDSPNTLITKVKVKKIETEIDCNLKIDQEFEDKNIHNNIENND